MDYVPANGAPDPMVFLQTAQDIAYSANAADKFTTDRNALDTKRIQAIQHYLNSHTAGRSLVFQVAVHDPGEVGISATPVQQSISRLNASSVGTLPSGGGGGASASGGAGAR